MGARLDVLAGLAVVTKIDGETEVGEVDRLEVRAGPPVDAMERVTFVRCDDARGAEDRGMMAFRAAIERTPLVALRTFLSHAGIGFTTVENV